MHGFMEKKCNALIKINELYFLVYGYLDCTKQKKINIHFYHDQKYLFNKTLFKKHSYFSCSAPENEWNALKIMVRNFYQWNSSCFMQFSIIMLYFNLKNNM